MSFISSSPKVIINSGPELRITREDKNGFTFYVYLLLAQIKHNFISVFISSTFCIPPPSQRLFVLVIIISSRDWIGKECYLLAAKHCTSSSSAYHQIEISRNFTRGQNKTRPRPSFINCWSASLFSTLDSIWYSEEQQLDDKLETIIIS